MRSIWMMSALLVAAFVPGVAQAQTKAVPLVPQRWLTNDDYPKESLRNKESGTTGFRLDIDATGRVTGCTVTESSGHLRLDETTCLLMRKRGRFRPATDTSGAKIPSQWSSRFNWWVGN